VQWQPCLANHRPALVENCDLNQEVEHRQVTRG